MAKNAYAVSQIVNGRTYPVKHSNRVGQQDSREFLSETVSRLKDRGWTLREKKADTALLISPNGNETHFKINKV